jgi:hypothetical protein
VSHASAAHDRFKVVRLQRRARVLDGADVVSEVIDHPGPTDTLFDVLAACVASLAPGPRVAVLGFAAGGLVAPLRAMGFAAPLRAVDLSLRNVALFHELCRDWCGDVRVERSEALAWLRKRRQRFDLIVEDLAVSSRHDAVKPDISLHALPQLVARRLQPRGIAVTNVLPMPGRAWHTVLRQIASPFESACVVHLDEYVNRILLTGRLPSASAVSRRIRSALANVGSTQANAVAVRSLLR